MKDSLTVQFQTVTPMFLSGADQRKAEIRIPSLKGALRFWYRAVDPDYIRHEPILFGNGGKGGGQSRFWMKLNTPMRPQSEEWDKSKGQKPGLAYLSFSLGQGRKYLFPRKESVEITICRRRIASDSREAYEADWKRLMAAVWLLGHVGGLGARSRRGFGSFALKGMESDSEELKQILHLPVAHREKTPQAWMHGFQDGLQQIRDGFPGRPTADHTVIDRNSTFHLHPEGFATWDEAMNYMGILLQNNRKKDTGQGRWSHAASFGMPLMIKNRGTYKPKGYERHASPVWMRVVRIGDTYHPFIAVLSTFSELTAVGNKKEKLSVSIREAMKDFRQSLKESDLLEGGL
ncbi:type III-B CRISPR module RAMP protein Cmr1 [Paludifilum halophilum]|uniref:type III-B CRISPR module RAMP protein Cmr1 n=1 Tax=Paludifilum halophilum TaxID=1642702 RepID=UPI00146C7079|nr:type III-B CRISPR module RAMP protein Cmr1 [Paludifilum halophilum]